MPVKITYLGNPLLAQMARGRRTLKSVVEDRYKPNRFLMETIGKEIIAGFQGGRGLHMDGLHFTKDGRPVGQPGKPYPYGIRREKDPSGRPYAELSEVTIKVKRANDSHYTTSILQDRGGSDPESLINSLEYTVTYSPSKTAGVSGGVRVFMARNNERSWKMERGSGDGFFWIPSGNFKKGETKLRKVKVPARPHRGVQPAVGIKIRSMLTKWVRRYRNGG